MMIRGYLVAEHSRGRSRLKRTQGEEYHAFGDPWRPEGWRLGTEPVGACPTQRKACPLFPHSLGEALDIDCD